ncbi:MAG: S4 domain-containing protein [Saprospiraceae bacterium]
MASKMRVDKWLWVVRIYKSRTQATDACKKGTVKINDITLKASSLIEEGQILQVRKDKFNLVYEVVKLIPNRVSALLAVECYKNLTSEEELNKFKDWQSSAFYVPTNFVSDTRPTKKDRRELEDFLNDT